MRDKTSSPLFELAASLFETEYTRQIAAVLLTDLAIWAEDEVAAALMVIWLSETDDQIWDLNQNQRMELLLLIESHGIFNRSPEVLWRFFLRLIIDFRDQEAADEAIRQATEMGHPADIEFLKNEESQKKIT